MSEIKKPKMNEGERVELLSDFDSAAADAIIRLQSNIGFSSIDRKINCYAVTSAKEGEGKTTMISNLAAVYAEKGLSVAIVDLDLRRPNVHHLFHLENKLGAVDYVKGDAELEDVIHSSKGVDVVTAGSYTPFPGKILTSVKMKELIGSLKENHDYALIDLPPVLPVADAYLVNECVQGYLLVCCQHSSKKKDVVAACRTFEEKGLNIIGLVMTKVSTDEDFGNYGYGYKTKKKYGYGYGYYSYKARKDETK